MLDMNGTINSSAETAIGTKVEIGDEEEELNVPLLRKHTAVFYSFYFLLLVVLVQSAVPDSLIFKIVIVFLTSLV